MGEINNLDTELRTHIDVDNIARPLIRHIPDNLESLEKLEKEINESIEEKLSSSEDSTIISRYPILYIHSWIPKDDETINLYGNQEEIRKKIKYEVYVGEANDVFRRTKEHYDNMDYVKIKKRKKNGIEQEYKETYWSNAIKNNDNAKLYIIGHELFNKSFTLDLENTFIHLLHCVPNISHVTNLRGNPQRMYYPREAFDKVFEKIWSELQEDNPYLFPDVEELKNSAIYKASPFFNLTQEQEDAKAKILSTIYKCVNSNKKLQKGEEGTLILVEGQAGSGKTVLTSNIFYELLTGVYNEEIQRDPLDCNLLVNHDELLDLYTSMMERLTFEDVVKKPTKFINDNSNIGPTKSGMGEKRNQADPKEERIDVAFVDESHLLYTQNTQYFQGQDGFMIEDILKRAKVTVIMYDSRQVVRNSEYWTEDMIKKMRKKAGKNYIHLEHQLRMRANKDVNNWIKDITDNLVLSNFPKDFSSINEETIDYEIKIFDNPFELEKEIKLKEGYKDGKVITKDGITKYDDKFDANGKKLECSNLSRMIASYDWTWSSKTGPNYVNFECEYGNFKKPWNREILTYYNDFKDEYQGLEGYAINDLSWAEQKQTIDEIGSIYTVQGFDLNYAGVILGDSFTYNRETGLVEIREDVTKNGDMNTSRTLDKTTKITGKFTKELLQNELNILLTRGAKGLYIYATDSELRGALLAAQEGRLEEYNNER